MYNAGTYLCCKMYHTGTILYYIKQVLRCLPIENMYYISDSLAYYSLKVLFKKLIEFALVCHECVMKLRDFI